MNKRKFPKIIYLLVCFLLIFEQSGFAQIATELDIAGRISAFHNALTVDRFRPLHLRYLQYDLTQNNFKLLLDKGTLKNPSSGDLENTSKELLKYFLIGISLPNDSFWVNLRPDAQDNIIDNYLAQTDVGKIMLESDLQLKQDTAKFTSPQTPEGRAYWNKLYQKAGELYGSQNITIPTLTRPWIVPDEIIIRETADSAYVYKATLKVMLEQDYLKDNAIYSFKDPREKQLNEYSSQLIRETIIPKLIQEINTSKRYASLRQVYYSLILAQWFKARFAGKADTYAQSIDKKDLTNLTSKQSWSKSTYFEAYQKSFKDGEYNLKEPVSTPFGQVIRSYFSGGMQLGDMVGQPGAIKGLSNGSSSVSILGSERAIGNPSNLSGVEINADEAFAEGGMASLDVVKGWTQSYKAEYVKNLAEHLTRGIQGKVVKEKDGKYNYAKAIKYIDEIIRKLKPDRKRLLKKSLEDILVRPNVKDMQINLANICLARLSPNAKAVQAPAAQAGRQPVDNLAMSGEVKLEFKELNPLGVSDIIEATDHFKKQDGFFNEGEADDPFKFGDFLMNEKGYSREEVIDIASNIDKIIVDNEVIAKLFKEFRENMKKKPVSILKYEVKGIEKPSGYSKKITFLQQAGAFKKFITNFYKGEKSLIKQSMDPLGPALFKGKKGYIGTSKDPVHIKPEVWGNINKFGIYGSLESYPTYFSIDYELAVSHIIDRKGKGYLIEVDLDKLKELRQVFFDPEMRNISGEAGKTFITMYGIPVEAINKIYELQQVNQVLGAQDLGAQVSNVKRLDRLLRILNVLRKSEKVPQVSQDASDRDIIESCIAYLDSKNLITTQLDADGNLTITIKNSAFKHSDMAVRKFANAIRAWAINSAGGVKAINFQGKDGTWRIVGFATQLNNPNVLKHEQEEIRLRNQGYDWKTAHKMTGGQLEMGFLNQGIPGQEAEIGAAVDGLPAKLPVERNRGSAPEINLEGVFIAVLGDKARSIPNSSKIIFQALLDENEISLADLQAWMQNVADKLKQEDVHLKRTLEELKNLDIVQIYALDELLDNPEKRAGNIPLSMMVAQGELRSMRGELSLAHLIGLYEMYERTLVDRANDQLLRTRLTKLEQVYRLTYRRRKETSIYKLYGLDAKLMDIVNGGKRLSQENISGKLRDMAKILAKDRPAYEQTEIYKIVSWLESLLNNEDIEVENNDRGIFNSLETEYWDKLIKAVPLYPYLIEEVLYNQFRNNHWVFVARDAGSYYLTAAMMKQMGRIYSADTNFSLVYVSASSNYQKCMDEIYDIAKKTRGLDEISDKFKEKLKDNPEFATEVNFLYDELQKLGILKKEHLLIVDSFGTGSTPLFIKLVAEQYKKEEDRDAKILVVREKLNAQIKVMREEFVVDYNLDFVKNKLGIEPVDFVSNIAAEYKLARVEPWYMPGKPQGIIFSYLRAMLTYNSILDYRENKSSNGFGPGTPRSDQDLSMEYDIEAHLNDDPNAQAVLVEQAIYNPEIMVVLRNKLLNKDTADEVKGIIAKIIKAVEVAKDSAAQDALSKESNFKDISIEEGIPLLLRDLLADPIVVKAFKDLNINKIGLLKSGLKVNGMNMEGRLVESGIYSEEGNVIQTYRLDVFSDAGADVIFHEIMHAVWRNNESIRNYWRMKGWGKIKTRDRGNLDENLQEEEAFCDLFEWEMFVKGGIDSKVTLQAEGESSLSRELEQRRLQEIQGFFAEIVNNYPDLGLKQIIRILKTNSGSTLGDKQNNDINGPSSSPSIPQPIENLAGIDFRTLPIVIQAMSNLSVASRLPLASLDNINLDKELADIQRMVDVGITPSAERLKEYMQAACAQGVAEKDTDKVIACISDILRLEEERCCVTEPVIRDILVVLEAGSSSAELNQVFLGKTI